MTTGGKVVVDASVAVKWYVPEAGSAEAASLLASGDRLVAPDLLVAEFGNVLWKKVRRGELAVIEAAEILDAFGSACPVTLYPASLVLRPAFDIATDFQRSVYDALYLAVAVAEGCRLVTADDRFVQALKGTRLERFLSPLADSSTA